MTSIRPATAADMAGVADLWHEGWHAGHAGHVPDGLTAARTLAAFHERTPARVADTAVAISDSGELLGFVMVVGDEVEQVFVGPAARGTGLAPALLAEAERLVAAGGHASAWLAVVAGNARARRFYEKCGWVDDGELPYEVTAGGEVFLSPCRRYVKAVPDAPDVAGVPAATSSSPAGVTTTTGRADPVLDQRLSDELTAYNADATSGIAAAEELTVRIEADGELVAGASGWTWGQAAGIGMTWVRHDRRGTGIGARLLAAFESEAADRGCTHVFVTSFTFQAPEFYQRLGYEEIFRWKSVPTPGRDDVHMRKDL